jgi:hypothetical protein
MAVPAGVASSGFVFTVSDAAGLSLVHAARKAAVVRATRQALFIGSPFSVIQFDCYLMHYLCPAWVLGGECYRLQAWPCCAGASP